MTRGLLPDTALIQLTDTVFENTGAPIGFDIVKREESAVCLTRGRHGYVVFRGTNSDFEWMDNANGMFMADTPCQINAARFVAEMRESMNGRFDSLTVTGHSKGGNNAQYAAITLPDGYVDRCVSVNGQGFSTEFTAKYGRNIAERRNRLALYAEARDVVNALGINAAATTFVRGQFGRKTPEYPHGKPIREFHDPNALLVNGRLGEIRRTAAIPAAVNMLIDYFLTSPTFIGTREAAATGIARLFCENREQYRDEIARAIGNIKWAFWDLARQSSKFRRSLLNVLRQEHDVLIASVETLHELYSLVAARTA